MDAKKITLSHEDKIRYQKLLRDGRMNLTRQGVYDASMMSVLKRARCTVERTNFESVHSVVNKTCKNYQFTKNVRLITNLPMKMSK